jgi:hypothetical protein
MKTVKLQNTVNSADMHELEIYHSAITASNLLTSSVSSSGIFTGVDLFKGLQFQVEDDINQFFIKNLTLCTNIGSGSLGEATSNVRFYEVYPGNYSTVNVLGTIERTSALPTTNRQNFALHPTLTLTATVNYPYEFSAWYSNAAFTGSALSNSNPVTISINDFDDTTTWYVQTQLGDNYY